MKWLIGAPTGYCCQPTIQGWGKQVKIGGFIAAAGVLALAGCDNAEVTARQTQRAAAAEKTAEGQLSGEVCRGITSATPGGDSSLRGAFASNEVGMDYGGGVIDALVKKKGYRFVGAEVVNGTCYAYAQATGEQWGKPFNLRWRCPVKAYSDDPKRPGQARLQIVEDRLCDFDVSPGDAGTKEVDVEVFRM